MSFVDITRRNVLKLTGVTAAGALGASGLAVAKNPTTNGPPFEEGEYMWGSDGTENWWMHGASESNPGNANAKRDFYIIQPVGDCAQSEFGFPHDTVIDTPSSGDGKFTAVWDPELDIDTSTGGPADLVEIAGVSATPGEGPTIELIEELEDDGDVVAIQLEEAIGVETNFDFVCPVMPRQFAGCPE